MEHFYIIANLDKEYVQEAQVFIKACLLYTSLTAWTVLTLTIYRMGGIYGA